MYVSTYGHAHTRARPRPPRAPHTHTLGVGGLRHSDFDRVFDQIPGTNKAKGHKHKDKDEDEDKDKGMLSFEFRIWALGLVELRSCGVCAV